MRLRYLNALITVTMAAALSRGQSVSITSPANGTVVTPGAKLSIAVSATPPSGSSPSTILNVMAGGEGMLGYSEVEIQSPYRLSISVPSDLAPGTYSLNAFAWVTGNDPVFSSPVTVDVERSDTPVRLEVQPAAIQFHFAGEVIPITPIATFSDGASVIASRSKLVSYTAAANSVATAGEGLATAVRAGTSSITVSYSGLSVEVPVTLAATVSGDLNGDGVVDQDDVNIELAADGLAATGPFDARDLNHDGIVDSNDVTLERQLCTLPGCARKCTCDVNGDGQVDINDIKLIVAARNSTASAPNDPRDPDGDGIITTNDARICTLQCKNALCKP